MYADQNVYLLRTITISYNLLHEKPMEKQESIWLFLKKELQDEVQSENEMHMFGFSEHLMQMCQNSARSTMCSWQLLHSFHSFCMQSQKRQRKEKKTSPTNSKLLQNDHKLGGNRAYPTISKIRATSTRTNW